MEDVRPKRWFSFLFAEATVCMRAASLRFRQFRGVRPAYKEHGDLLLCTKELFVCIRIIVDLVWLGD